MPSGIRDKKAFSDRARPSAFPSRLRRDAIFDIIHTSCVGCLQDCSTSL